ncbi:PAS domain-containing protein [Streptomyces sp. CAU 1734]|uniref:helix-turn-helix transcriptional regulator n=1 Tax=Streptomyces sp. CAU 1734 TaxID=3140360 RepID=UPI003261691D
MSGAPGTGTPGAPGTGPPGGPPVGPPAGPPPGPSGLPEDELLIREAEKIVTAVGRMFPGLCEVVLHDLRDPGHSLRAIENNLSGRTAGEPATELGLARIQDPGYPDILQNYPNRFPDGRPAKSTSIGIRNSRGTYVAALCLNLDLSLLTGIAGAVDRLTRTCEPPAADGRPLAETLRARTADGLNAAVAAYAAARGTQPHALSATARGELVRELEREGFLQVKHAVRTLAGLLGVSRATVYGDLRRAPGE